jgi:hypothetical protein
MAGVPPEKRRLRKDDAGLIVGPKLHASAETEMEIIEVSRPGIETDQTVGQKVRGDKTEIGITVHGANSLDQN